MDVDRPAQIENGPTEFTELRVIFSLVAMTEERTNHPGVGQCDAAFLNEGQR